MDGLNPGLHTVGEGGATLPGSPEEFTMRLFTRGATALLLGSALTAVAAAQPPAGAPQPAPPVPGVAPPAPPAPGPTPPPPVGLAPPALKPEPRPNGVAATVNGAQVPEVAVYRALRQFPATTHHLARKEIVNHLIENVLVEQYLNAIKVVIEEKEVDDLVSELKKELVQAKKDYAKELEAMLLTETEFRDEVRAQLRWEKFFKDQAKEDVLQKQFAANPDVFDATMVRARHILLNPGNDKAKQQEFAGKLRGIKAGVEAEAAKAVAAAPPGTPPLKLEEIRKAKTEETFGLYAKEYSECPSKKEGGDLNFFPRAGAMVEPFAKAAFDLKPSQMTDVVATEFGYHLILVTDRKQGTPKKFEEVKEDVKMYYAMKLREAVVAQMKQKAQITITPVAVEAAPANPAAGTTVPAGGTAAPMSPAAPGVPKM
jgi:parvulin-like peptidyl-prolyl isomerase